MQLEGGRPENQPAHQILYSRREHRHITHESARKFDVDYE